MNTLALNFGRDARRFISSDTSAGVDFYGCKSFRRFLKAIRLTAHGRIIKEHHQLAFFGGLIGYLRENFLVFYIVRNPADTMVSFCRYVREAQRHMSRPWCGCRLPEHTQPG